MNLFLSHATESKPLVQRIARRLPDHVEHWLDVTKLRAGDNFEPRIEEAIAKECDFLVAFLDAGALAREWVPREVRMGLRREAELGRPFVIPVLLEDVRDRLHLLAEGFDKRLYITAWDHDAKALGTAARRLAEELFAQTSRIVEGLRGVGMRGMVQSFADDFTRYKQAAFQWRAAAGNDLAVLTTNQAAFDHLAASVQAYNEAADPFIARLPLHRDRITAAWSLYKGLCEDVRGLVAAVEKLYRGEMYELNRIGEMVNRVVTNAPDAPTLAAFDARRAELVAAAGTALDAVSKEATRVIEGLEREIR